jgi:hypothetical protein
MNTIYKKIRLDRKPEIVLIAFPHILLVVVVAALLALMVLTCIKFTKGPLSATALRSHLLQLQSKFITSASIDPEAERQEMEKLQNKIKTFSDRSTISGNKDLRQLFASNCKYIRAAMTDANPVNRSSWIKFQELMFNFDKFYFHA